MKRALLALGGCLSFCLIASPSKAAILSVSGDGKVISAPTSVVNSSKAGGYFDNVMSGFDEKQNLILSQDLKVDSLVQGKVQKDKKASSGNSLITAGTRINSHMLFLNQKDGEKNTIEAKATWKFDGTILGVMSDLDGLLLSASDFLLGAEGTKYGAQFKNRGMETGDIYSVLAPNELSVNMRITQPGDWIRVITAAPNVSAVPEPTTLLGLLGAGAWGLSLRKRAQPKQEA